MKQKPESKHHLFSFFGILSLLVIMAFFSMLLGGKSTGMAVQQSEKTYLSCTEFDFDNQFIAGTATITYTEKGLKKSEVVADTCTGKILKEAICNGGKYLVYQSSTCVLGCGKTSVGSYCKCNVNSQCGKGYRCLNSACVKNK